MPHGDCGWEGRGASPRTIPASSGTRHAQQLAAAGPARSCSRRLSGAAFGLLMGAHVCRSPRCVRGKPHQGFQGRDWPQALHRRAEFHVAWYLVCCFVFCSCCSRHLRPSSFLWCLDEGPDTLLSASVISRVFCEISEQPFQLAITWRALAPVHCQRKSEYSAVFRMLPETHRPHLNC